jgi:hypothetical protein
LVELKRRANNVVVGNGSVVVELNVGGRMFTTTRELLVKHEASVLAQMIINNVPTNNNDDNNEPHHKKLLIDADGDAFAYIMSWLRRGVVPYDLPAYEARLVLAEAQFWALDELVLALGGDIDGVEPVRKAKGHRISQAALLQCLQVSNGGGLSLPGANLSGTL